MKIMRNGTLCEMTQEEEMMCAPTPEERIEELKELLAETDYRTLKYVEGQLGEEEYASSKLQRAAWRAEIEYLENIRRDETSE